MSGINNEFFKVHKLEYLNIYDTTWSQDVNISPNLAKILQALFRQLDCFDGQEICSEQKQGY